ncbi:MAG TPA: phosphotransferase [Steroidobacteraceae bacterium]
MADKDVLETIAALPCWSSPIEVHALVGGLTNRNFRVNDRDRQSFVVRIGHDIPEHGVMRFNELASARAAYAAGITPEVIYASKGILVSRFIEGSVLTPAHVRDPQMLERIVALLQRCHREVAQHFQGPALIFWVFQVIRGYLTVVEARGGGPTGPELKVMAARAARLEQAVGPVRIVFAHNDLLAANLIDDGKRLWLIDWDYAGFNSPLFDLANLSTNNELSPDLQEAMLNQYFCEPINPDVRRGFAAMQCASLLRETLWAAVYGLTSTIAFNYRSYGDNYQKRFERNWLEFEQHYG